MENTIPDIERKVIEKLRVMSLIKQLEDNNTEWTEDFSMQLQVYILLLKNSGSTFVNSENTEYSVVDGDLISKKYIHKTKEMKKIEDVIIPEPLHVFERIEYQKEVTVEGKKGFVTDWEEYVNGKTYYEYSEDSYERKNWRTIEYNWRNFIKF